MKLLSIGTFLSLALMGAAFSADDDGPGNSVKKPFDPSSNGKGGGHTTTPQMTYHGGPIMNMSNSVYVIYYGSFAATTQPIINAFLVGLSGSLQYGVNSVYGTPTMNTIPSTYAFTPPTSAPVNGVSGSAYFDNYSQGPSLGNSSIPRIVAHALAGGLPTNHNGVYLVVTSPDVKISGFCNSFCAYHNSSTAIADQLPVRYALIPDPSQKCSACNGGVANYGDVVTPNLDMGADAMTDDIMHELSETVTDPDISAWYTQNGAEVGDLCNYVYETGAFPAVHTVPRMVNGKTYTTHVNASFNGRDFLIQFIWKNSGTSGACAPQ